VTSRTIVVADDDGDIRLMIHCALSADGLDVLEVADGLAALEVLERQDAAALVTDVSMPRLDGAQLVAALRERHSTLPVVVTTGLYDDDARMHSLMRQPGVRILPKPFRTSDLRRVVLESVLGGTPIDSPQLGATSLQRS